MIQPLRKGGRPGAAERDEDVDLQPREPEEYVLELKMTVSSTREPIPLTRFFAQWHATSIDADGTADLGFMCKASSVRDLTDTLAHLLDEDLETLAIHIKKNARLEVDRRPPS